VRKLPRLYVVMLRYRVAAMVALFMLLGAAREGRLELGFRHVWAALALASSYVAATALNDLADEQIDRVNHPRDAGRPLVEGTATRADVLILHVLASLAAVAAALPLGPRGVGLIAVSLVVSQVYSATPVRLSYRVAGAPLALAVAYVLVPFALGIVTSGGSLAHVRSRLVGALVLLFAARIVLKDFRDREGDARFGKPTLLLRYGKTATCATSLGALVAGDVVLAATLDARLTVLLQPLVLAIASMLRRLWHATSGRDEQVAIGLGARLGNGLLLCLLGWLAVRGAGAPVAAASAFVTALCALFLASFAALGRRPGDVVIGYKG